MQSGVVSNLIVTKKYGFISGDSGNEYFFHMMDMASNWDELVTAFLEKGGGKVNVSFEAVKTSKGPRAKNVTVA